MLIPGAYSVSSPFSLQSSARKEPTSSISARSKEEAQMPSLAKDVPVADAFTPVGPSFACVALRSTQESAALAGFSAALREKLEENVGRLFGV